jgi:hypothetical protein
MKSIFHGREALVRLPLFATLGLAIFWGVFSYLSAHGHEIGSSNMSLREHIEFDPETPPSNKEYTGPQNAQELMKALDADYNKRLVKIRVSISGKFAGTKAGTKTVIFNNVVAGSDLTISEIDARYPRAEWLQLLLDKSITIDDSHEYASMLSKRYTLALLEDNPDLQQLGVLGIPPTDDWETYKAAYINKLVNDHIRMREAVEQIERGKKAVERANAQIKHSKKQIERAKAQAEQSKEQVKLAIERSKETIERAKAQLERSTEQLERAQKELNSQQSVHLKKQIESVRGTLEPPKPPKEPTPPQEPK